MFLSQYFSYDRKKSIDMGVCLLYVNKNLDNIHFGLNREAIEERIGDRNYLYGITKKRKVRTIELKCANN